MLGVTFISSGWFILWYGQWQLHLNDFIWLRLGIGLILFIIPGGCLYHLLARESTITSNHLSFGFVFSHLALAFLGTAGRLIHLPFETIKLFMMLLGLILIISCFFQMPLSKIKNKPFGISIRNAMSVLLMIMVATVACLIVIQRVLTDDDLTYLAYVTNWQNNSQLDFKDIIFGQPGLVHPRFWLVCVPFAQALLANISQVPGILILSGYYEPFLVILSTLCWFELARTLKFSSRAASASAMLQLAFLLLLSEYLHPGAPFFNQLSTDKATAAFILAPVFFQSLAQFLNQSTKNNVTLFLLVGLSLTFMHPVILAYAVFIGGVFVLFNFKSGSHSLKILPLIVILIILLPQIALRFVTPRESIPYSSESIFNQKGIENMIQRWDNSRFYGFNPAILDMKIPYGKNLPISELILKRIWLIFPVLSAIFALRQDKSSLKANFMLSCFLLCLLVWIPFTGWIIGYFLSAWMLERAIWLFPFGMSTVYTLSIIWTKIAVHSIIRTASNIRFASITALVLGLFFLYMSENNLPEFAKFAGKSQRYEDIAMAGQALDSQISDQAYVMGSPIFNDLIPGISWKSKLITFRISDPSNMFYFTSAERDERITDTNLIFSKATSAENKWSLLRKYDIRFLFLQRDDIRLFNDLITSHPNRITVMEIGGVIILAINY